MALSYLLNHNTVYQACPQADPFVIEDLIKNALTHGFSYLVELIHRYVPGKSKALIDQQLYKQYIGANGLSVNEVTVRQLMKFFYLCFY